MQHRTPQLIIVLVLALLTQPLHAREQPKSRETVWTMTLSPAAEPVPAFKHRLTYRLSEQVPGNGNPLLQTAISLMSTSPELSEQFDALWNAEDPAIEDRRRHVGNYASALRYLELATKRTTYDPETPLRELGFEALLPSLSTTRKLANILDMRLQVEIHDQDIPAAVRSLRTGYTLAKQVGDQHTLVESLVGIGIAALMNNRTRDLIQLQSAPNLYWSLAELRPLIDGRNAIQGEASWFYFSFQGMDLTRRDEFVADQWRQVLAGVARVFQTTPAADSGEADPIQLAAMVAASIGPSRQILQTSGFTDAQIERMSPQEIVGRAMLLDYEIAMDDITKAWHLPTPQALAVMRATEERFAAQKDRSLLPFARMLIPSLSRARLTVARLDRDLAMLMTIEALRAHAAANAGSLPASFDELTVLPVPPNPYTGQPFEYRRTDTGCEILCPPAAGDSTNESLRVVITLRK